MEKDTLWKECAQICTCKKFTRLFPVFLFRVQLIRILVHVSGID